MLLFHKVAFIVSLTGLLPEKVNGNATDIWSKASTSLQTDDVDKIWRTATDILCPNQESVFINDPWIREVISIAEECFDLSPPSTTTTSQDDDCEPEDGEAGLQKLDVIIIASMTSVGFLIIAAAIIAGVRKKRANDVKRMNRLETSMALTNAELTRRKNALTLRPLPVPEEEARYSYLELVDNSNAARKRKMPSPDVKPKSVNLETGGYYLTPIATSTSKEAATVSKDPRPDSQNSDHDYQEVHTYYEIMK